MYLITCEDSWNDDEVPLTIVPSISVASLLVFQHLMKECSAGRFYLYKLPDWTEKMTGQWPHQITCWDFYPYIRKQNALRTPVQ